MAKFSALSVWETQKKTTVKYHFIAGRVIFLMEKMKDNQCWQRDREKGTFVCCW